ncbi:hypothetical protein LCGC14_1007340 [marine sediment metagenome]|uniref:Uncharacterized protein n=1 Tax=marine sediment metagenome TaxID=412755 RepID=A0A0F9NMT0_9ZZZZ
MILKYGTKESILSFLKTAKDNNVRRIWSGHFCRSVSLREKLFFGVFAGILTLELKEDYNAQESDIVLTWVN